MAFEIPGRDFTPLTAEQSRYIGKYDAVEGGYGPHRILEAMDGRNEAHMDVLVAVLWGPYPPLTFPGPIRLLAL